MKNRPVVYTTIFLLVIFLAISFFYLKAQKDRKIAAEQRIQELRDELAKKDPNKKEIFATSTPYLNVKIEYPKDFPNIKEKIFAAYNTFLSETNILSVKSKADAEQYAIPNGAKYDFISEYKVATSSDTISFISKNYSYTGGAHGGVSTSVITVNSGGYLPPDYFIPNSALVAVSQYAYDDLKKQIETRTEMTLEDDSMLKDGTTPRRENYLIVWPDGDDTIVVYFGQYQVGPYVYGDFEVRVPKTLIK